MGKPKSAAAQARLQREQDGSEVKSVQLETLIGIGQNLIERRDSMETFRDIAADLFLRTCYQPHNWPHRVSAWSKEGAFLYRRKDAAPLFFPVRAAA